MCSSHFSWLMFFFVVERNHICSLTAVRTARTKFEATTVEILQSCRLTVVDISLGYAVLG